MSISDALNELARNSIDRSRYFFARSGDEKSELIPEIPETDELARNQARRNGESFRVAARMIEELAKGITDCRACGIEREIGTEEESHPVLEKFHICLSREGGPERNPDGRINNCAIANGENEKSCQVCGGTCPDLDRHNAPGDIDE